jgi:iron complex outermembrane receptor protein
VYYRNAARTNRTGVEVGFKCEPFEEVEMVINYTYTHFRYQDYVVTEFTPTGQMTADYSGNTVPSVPTSLLNFILFYTVEFTDQLEGLILWDCDYVSQMFVNDGNSETAPAYFYGNILTGLDVGFQDFSFVVYGGVHNIFDRRYAGYINVNDYNERYYETGEPRSFYAGLKMNFRP